MLNFLKKPVLLTVLACAALASTAVALASTGTSAQTSARGQPAIFEGPGGRTALTHWTRRNDPTNDGIALGWQNGRFSGTKVSVPNVVNAGAYRGKAGAANYEGSIAWYRTSFQAPQAGTYALGFQSANYLASVWVDGHAVGSHKGSYLPFEVRRTLAAGNHTVVVRVDWEDPAKQSQEGFHRTWFNWGGIDGPVEVRRVGESELSQPTLQTTLTPNSPESKQATVKVSVLVHNYGPTRTIAPEGSLVRGTQTIPLTFTNLTLEHDQTATATATAQISEPALWSPTGPALYELSLSLGTESSYVARVGLRQLTWHGGHAYLNGQVLSLHGASIQEDALGHGDALTSANQATLVDELKSINANVVRSQHPLDAGLLEKLDAAGILVWQGIGPVEGAGEWQSNTPQLLASAEQQARTAVLAEDLHPSIFTWNLVDEVANNGQSPDEVQYVRATSRWIHEHDPTRMVAVDVWGDHPPTHAGALYAEADAVAETDYSGWYDNPHDTPTQLEAEMRGRLAAMERTFAGKVLVISEFGTESNLLNQSGAPGSYSYQSRILAEHIKVYEADPKLTAMLVWVLRDYPLTPTFQGGSIHQVLPRLKLLEGLNQKGLYTYGGTAKPAARTVAHLFGTMPRM